MNVAGNIEDTNKYVVPVISSTDLDTRKYFTELQTFKRDVEQDKIFLFSGLYRYIKTF